MARQIAPRRRSYQPRNQFPRLRGAYADAVFVYLPSVSTYRARDHQFALDPGQADLVTFSYIAGDRKNVYFPDCSIKALANTQGLAFNTTGMTVLTIGYYTNTVGGIRCIINRSNAGATGGFNVNYFNSVGAGPRIYSSYNHPSTGDTNWDSAWVNGAKDGTGNGSFTTDINTRYVFAGTAAVGPAASATTEMIIGKESISGQPGGETAVELIVIWPRKFTEQQMFEITRDPYQIFNGPGRLSVNGIASDVTVEITGVSATGSVNGPGKTITRAIPEVVSATGSVGTISPGTSPALSALTGTTSINGLVVSRSVPIVGQSATGSVGTVTAETSTGDRTIGITGVTGTGSVGSLGKGVTKTIPSLLAINILGTITASGSTPIQTGNPWISVAFHPSVAAFRSVAEFAGVVGNPSV
jgi:hypothetical protein